MRKMRRTYRYIVIAAILSLGILGISYASWNDSLLAGATISTGNIGLSFVDQYSINPVPEEGLEVDISPDNVYISGTIISADKIAELKLYVQNTGSFPVSLPAEFGNVVIEPDTLPQEIVFAIGESPINQRLTYSITNKAESWSKSLAVNGVISFIPPLTVPTQLTTDSAFDLPLEQLQLEENK